MNEQERQERAKAAASRFEEGLALYRDEKPLEAFRVWSQSYKDLGSSFLESQDIQSQLRLLRKDSQKKQKASQILEALAKDVLAQGKLDRSLFYAYFSQVMFDEGVTLECHEALENISLSTQRWKQEYEDLGEPLYARYRLSLLDGAQGKLEEAIHGLQFCEDRFPPKKHESLRLKPLRESLVRAKDAINAAKEGKLVLATPSAWEAAGFLTPFESRSWKRAGIPPELAQEFRQAGFTAKKSGPWTKIGFRASEAERWIAAGVKEAEQAKRWNRASVAPEKVGDWNKAFRGDVDAAILFYKAGFEDPEEAFRWSQVFQFPSDAMNWKEQEFTSEEAQFWYQDAGLKDPYSARKEKELLSKPKS